MMHRFAICIVLLSLATSARPDERAVDNNAENWVFGVGSDASGGTAAYLGVDITDVTTERLSALKLKEEHGAEVTMVDSDAPAGKAGLRDHDVILSLNGTAVESAAQLRRMIKEIPPGRVVTIGVSRDGQPLEVKAQLADRRKSMAWQPSAHDFKFEMPNLPSIPDMDLPVSVVIAHSSVRSGLMIENITPQLGEFFGVKNGKGVLIRTVEKGSRGEKAGFRAGDVIVKVNAQSVRDTSDFTHALRESASSSATVTVVRDKKEQNLTLTLPDKKDSGLLLEDSFEIPDFSADTQLAVREAERQIARLGPTMEKAQRDIRKKFDEQQKKMQGQQQKMLERQQKLMQEFSGKWGEI